MDEVAREEEAMNINELRQRVAARLSDWSAKRLITSGNLEIKSHRWTEDGQRMGADFFPFIDGEPRHDICIRT